VLWTEAVDGVAVAVVVAASAGEVAGLYREDLLVSRPPLALAPPEAPLTLPPGVPAALLLLLLPQVSWYRVL
jgi:hypothetical protein